MNGHVAGPLVRGQKVRVVLLGTVERSHGGWELYCGGETVALDSEAIVNIQFIDDPPLLSDAPNVCPAEAPTGVHCAKIEGHAGSHAYHGLTW